MNYKTTFLMAIIVTMGVASIFADEWQFKGLAGRKVISLAADPDNDQNICAGTDSGLYVSFDGGDNWDARISIEHNFPDLAYPPLANDTILALASDGAVSNGLYYSNTAGNSWSMISALNNPRRMGFDPVNPGFMYICFSDGILKSQNYGLNVSSANNGLPGFNILDVVGDGVHGFEAYAVGSNFLAHTTDFGNIWTEINGQFDVLNHNPYRLAFNPNGPETLYVTCYAYFARSVNGGLTWNYTEMTALEITPIVCDPEVPGRLFVGSAAGGGVFISTNAGLSFVAINNNLGDQHVHSLELNANGGLLAGTDDGIYYLAPPIGINETGPDLPMSITLKQNYPNPFNDHTIIEIDINEPENCRVDIYDIAGRLVRQLYTGEGGHRILPWDGADDEGQVVSSGMYFYRLKTADNTICKRMTYLK